MPRLVRHARLPSPRVVVLAIAFVWLVGVLVSGARAQAPLAQPQSPDARQQDDTPGDNEADELPDKPPPLPLGHWRKKHPNTTVLLGSKARIERLEASRSGG